MTSPSSALPRNYRTQRGLLFLFLFLLFYSFIFLERGGGRETPGMGGKGGEDGGVHCLFNEQVPKTLIMHHFVFGADAHDA